MCKFSPNLSSFYHSHYPQEFIYIFYWYDVYSGKLLIKLSIKSIYKFLLQITACIKQIQFEMYNSENLRNFLRKSSSIQKMNVEKIHKADDLRTIYRDKNMSFS